MSIQYDFLTGLECIVKRPNETVTYFFDFSNMILEDDYLITITSAIATNRHAADVVDPLGVIPTVVSSDVVAINAGITDTKLGELEVSGGQDQEFYVLEFTVVTNLGDTRTCSGVIKVVDV